MLSGNYRMVMTLLQSFVNLFVSDELRNINVLIFLATLHYFYNSLSIINNSLSILNLLLLGAIPSFCGLSTCKFFVKNSRSFEENYKYNCEGWASYSLLREKIKDTHDNKYFATQKILLINYKSKTSITYFDYQKYDTGKPGSSR